MPHHSERDSCRYLVAARGRTPDHGLLHCEVTDGDAAVTVLASVRDLSALAWHPHLPVVYGTYGSGEPGRVAAWTVAETGAELLSDVPAGQDAPTGRPEWEPCHLLVDPSGRLLAVANYTSAEVVLWRLDGRGAMLPGPLRLAMTGSGPDSERQSSAHPHQVHWETTRSGVRLYVVDLGADCLRVFEVELDAETGVAAQATSVHRMPAGTGPRHATFLPGGRVALSGELSSTLLVGALAAVPEAWEVIPSTELSGPAHTRSPRNYPGDIQSSALGDLVYLANRGHDTLAIVDVSSTPSRMLREIVLPVAWPQQLLVDADRLVIAGWDSSQLAIYPLHNGMPGSDCTLVPVLDPGWVLPHPARRGASV